jgi:hypothetical protein
MVLFMPAKTIQNAKVKKKEKKKETHVETVYFRTDYTFTALSNRTPPYIHSLQIRISIFIAINLYKVTKLLSINLM